MPKSRYTINICEVIHIVKLIICSVTLLFLLYIFIYASELLYKLRELAKWIQIVRQGLADDVSIPTQLPSYPNIFEG